MPTTIKSYSFFFKDPNDLKLNLLTDKAKLILNLKNSISNSLTFQDLLKSKFDFLKKYNTQIEGLSGQDIQKALEDVFDCYSNKVDKYTSDIKFKIQKEIKIERYKRNTKNNKVDDIRIYEVILGQSKLTFALTYLSKFWNDGLLDYVRKQSNEEKDSKKKEMYRNILCYIDTYGNRLIELAKSRRSRVSKSVFEHRIEFRSLNFRSLNQISKCILDWNKNRKSLINTFITLGGYGKNNREQLQIPTKYSLDYHGKIKDFQKGKNTSYTVVFHENKPQRIVLTAERNQETIINKTNYIGIDTNVKHNLFYTSTNLAIDFDRKEFNDYVCFLKYLDKKSKNLNSHDSKHKAHWQIKIQNMLKRKCNELVKRCISQGKDHLVLEDLGQFAKGFTRNDVFEGFKYSRLVRLLNLADLKNIIKSIANKKGIQVTFVQSPYTSQTCSKCGFVSKENRKSQEEFCCLECGNTLNADFNASRNIENRLSLDVLRTSLLRSGSEGYEAKNLSKQSILSILYNYYSCTTNEAEDLVT